MIYSAQHSQAMHIVKKYFKKFSTINEPKHSDCWNFPNEVEIDQLLPRALIVFSLMNDFPFVPLGAF